MATEGYFERVSSDQIEKAATELAAHRQSLEALELEWLEIAEQIETASAGD